MTSHSPATRIATRKKKHHYVPCWYLRRWCNRKGKLVSFTKHTPDGALVIPETVCFVNNLHTIFGDLRKYDEIENFLSDEFEGPAKQALDAILSGEPHMDHKLSFSRFMLHLQGRHPSLISAMSLDAENHFHEFTKDFSDRDRTTLHRMYPARDLARDPLARIDEDEARKLAKWPWRTINTSSSLVTTDRPVVSHRITELIEAVSIGVDDRTVLYAISKNSVLAQVPNELLVRAHIIGALRYSTSILSRTRRTESGWEANSLIDYSRTIQNFPSSCFKADPMPAPVQWRLKTLSREPDETR